MSEHTKEPWHVGGPNCSENRCGIRGADYVIADLCEDGHDDAMQEANARRIVAAINACAGIPTYQLTVEDGNPLLLGDTIDALRKQRDDLLAAAKAFKEYQNDMDSGDDISAMISYADFVSRIDAAIAAAEPKP